MDYHIQFDMIYPRKHFTVYWLICLFNTVQIVQNLQQIIYNRKIYILI